MKHLIPILLLMSTFTVFSQNQSLPVLKMYKRDNSVVTTPLTDIDSLVHVSILPTEILLHVKIGYQVWTAKNLEVSTYRNGEPIRHASTPEEWQDATTKKEGAWCYYDFDAKNGVIYGKLYNWFSVNDKRGLAPAGYHIPSDAEWSVLTESLGGVELSGTKLKSSSGWINSGDNSSGFNALPGGRCLSYGEFTNLKEYGYWWCSLEYSSYSAWSRGIYSEYEKVNRSTSSKHDGFSVRLIRD